MLGVVKKWGNSAAVRIPASLLDSAHITLDQQVDVREAGGCIVIEPVRSARSELDILIDAITDENRHEPVDTGKPVGREVW